MRAPGEDALAAIFTARYAPSFDVALNVLAYAPFGALAFMALRGPDLRAGIAKATTAGFALSLVLETCQLFIAFRHASAIDVAANAAGAFLGALAFTDPVHALVTRPLGDWRERRVIAGTWGDTGLILVAAWLLAQLNPALPFFQAGNIGTEVEFSMAATLLPALAVALSVCGFGLFLSVLLRGPGGALRATLLLLTMALWLKFATASTMLKPHFSAEWLTGDRVVGLVVGLSVFVPLRLFGRAARMYLAFLLLLAGALFAKIFGAYSATAELVRLFSWPYGQLLSFASLTRYLHEVWPFAAIVFLVALFLKERRGAVT